MCIHLSFIFFSSFFPDQAIVNIVLLISIFCLIVFSYHGLSTTLFYCSMLHLFMRIPYIPHKMKIYIKKADVTLSNMAWLSYDLITSVFVLYFAPYSFYHDINERNTHHFTTNETEKKKHMNMNTENLRFD